MTYKASICHNDDDYRQPHRRVVLEYSPTTHIWRDHHGNIVATVKEGDDPIKIFSWVYSSPEWDLLIH